MKGHVAAAAVAFASLAREGVQPAGDVVLALTATRRWASTSGRRGSRASIRKPSPGATGSTRAAASGVSSARASTTSARSRRRRPRPSSSGCTAAAATRPIRMPPTTRCSRPDRCSTRSPASSRRVLRCPRCGPSWTRSSGTCRPSRRRSTAPPRCTRSQASSSRRSSRRRSTPTMIEASRKRNVIPGSCVIEVDCRLLPGQEPAEMEALLRAGVPGDSELEWIVAEQVGGKRDHRSTHRSGVRSRRGSSASSPAPGSRRSCVQGSPTASI